MPRQPLLYFPSRGLFSLCRPPPFIKRNKCLCLTLQYALPEHGERDADGGGGAHCPSLLTSARQRAEWFTRSATQASINYRAEVNIAVNCSCRTLKGTMHVCLTAFPIIHSHLVGFFSPSFYDQRDTDALVLSLSCKHWHRLWQEVEAGPWRTDTASVARVRERRERAASVPPLSQHSNPPAWPPRSALSSQIFVLFHYLLSNRRLML